MDIWTALGEDILAKEIVQALANRAKQHHKVTLGKCTVDNNLLCIYGLLYVPDNENLYREIIYSHNDQPVAGHAGRAATHELVSRNY